MIAAALSRQLLHKFPFEELPALHFTKSGLVGEMMLYVRHIVHCICMRTCIKHSKVEYIEKEPKYASASKNDYLIPICLEDNFLERKSNFLQPRFKPNRKTDTFFHAKLTKRIIHNVGKESSRLYTTRSSRYSLRKPASRENNRNGGYPWFDHGKENIFP